MKTNLNPVRMILVLSLSTVLVTVIQRAVRPAPSVANITAVAVESAEPSEAVAEAMPVSAPVRVAAPVTRPAAAPEDVQAVPQGTAVEMGSDIELAYQLGEDVQNMTPEARARLRAEWEARVQAEKSGDQIN